MPVVFAGHLNQSASCVPVVRSFVQQVAIISPDGGSTVRNAEEGEEEGTTTAVIYAGRTGRNGSYYKLKLPMKKTLLIGES